MKPLATRPAAGSVAAAGCCWRLASVVGWSGVGGGGGVVAGVVDGVAFGRVEGGRSGGDVEPVFAVDAGWGFVGAYEDLLGEVPQLFGAFLGFVAVVLGELVSADGVAVPVEDGGAAFDEAAPVQAEDGLFVGLVVGEVTREDPYAGVLDVDLVEAVKDVFLPDAELFVRVHCAGSWGAGWG